MKSIPSIEGCTPIVQKALNVISGLLIPRPVDAQYPITAQFAQKGKYWGPNGHSGIDFGVPLGTEVRCVHDGRVVFCKEDHPVLGQGLWIQSKYKDIIFSHGYGHNSKLFVKDGQLVKAGELISLSGNSGHSSGPHLHFGMKLEPWGIRLEPNFIGG